MKKLILYLLLFLVSACCRNPATYKMPEDFKQYILFPKDSWWIYKDQNNNMDTLRLIRVDNSFIEDNCERIEGVATQYSSTRLGVFTANTQMFVPNIFYYCCNNYDKKYFMDLSSYKEDNPYISCSCAAYWHIEPSMVVENITYNDVFVVIADSIDYYEDYKPSESYFVKNIGLIQVKYFDGSEWKLTDFFINNKP